MNNNNPEKKDVARFTIRFHITGPFPDPDHIDAVDTLNALEYGQAANFLAKAIAVYKKCLMGESMDISQFTDTSVSKKVNYFPNRATPKRQKKGENAAKSGIVQQADGYDTPLVNHSPELVADNSPLAPVEVDLPKASDKTFSLPVISGGNEEVSKNHIEDAIILPPKNDQIEEDELSDIMDALEAFGI